VYQWTRARSVSSGSTTRNKSRFLYFPEENHWVLKPQNAQVWQAEFFKWLKETYSSNSISKINLCELNAFEYLIIF
jgi:hypothetical protein